jgi:hypothetical protein
MQRSRNVPIHGNRYRVGAKFDELTFTRLVYCFCQGIGTGLAARSTGLSVKTVRSLYIALRQRLLKPAFNRWHGTNRKFIALSDPTHERALHTGYFEALAQCAGHRTCVRNWRLGNRKCRQCRQCPLGPLFSVARRAEAYTVIDTVHDFYERLSIRGEKGADFVTLFRERLIHTTTIATVHNRSRMLESGFFDPDERSFLCGGTLLDALLIDLAAEPLA